MQRPPSLLAYRPPFPAALALHRPTPPLQAMPDRRKDMPAAAFEGAADVNAAGQAFLEAMEPVVDGVLWMLERGLADHKGEPCLLWHGCARCGVAWVLRLWHCVSWG